MRKRGLFAVFLVISLFILGCSSNIITQEKGLLSYSIKGCINKEYISREAESLEGASIQGTSNSVVISHKANHLCDLDIDIQQSIKEAQISIIEVFSGQGAKCICDSEINAEISPLEKGVYNVKVYQKIQDNPPELVNEKTVAVGDVTNNAIGCNDDSDCVPANCCHPQACVIKSEAPNCEGIFCTTECVPNTLDCNQGKCICENNKCEASIYS